MVELASFRFPQKFSLKGRWPLYIEIETRLICKDYKLYTCMNSAVKFHWYASSQLFLLSLILFAVERQKQVLKNFILVLGSLAIKIVIVIKKRSLWVI